MISGGLSGALIVLLALVVLLAVFFWPAVIAAGALIMALVNGSLGAAVIIGLIGGVIASQLLSDKTKAELADFTTTVIEAFAFSEYVVIYPIAWTLSIIVWGIIKMISSLTSSAMIEYNHRRRVYTTSTKQISAGA